ncbi:2126_t:CDS:2, partial [Acaulospora morrowiae]
MSKLDVSRREDQGIWKKIFITRLDKITEDDAYSEEQKKLALRLKDKLLLVLLLAKDGFVPSAVMTNLLSADTFWDNIEKEKEDLRRKREIENKTNLVRDNTKIEALELLDTACTERMEVILNSMKRKPEKIVKVGKRRKFPSGNESNDDDVEESDSEVIDIDEKEEIGNLTEDEIDIRNKLLRVLTKCQDNEKKSGKNYMKSIYLNNIICLSDMRIRRKIEKLLNEDQLAWFNNVLKKQTLRSQTDEFKKYLNQFNEDACNRTQIPTLVRNSFISGRFDSYYYEDYDIAHQLLEHCATRLDAHISYESKSFNLERTFAIDTVIYIINRLFKMHQDVLDSGWIELTTPDTKNHKFDGILKVIRTKLENQ